METVGINRSASATNHCKTLRPDRLHRQEGLRSFVSTENLGGQNVSLAVKIYPKLTNNQYILDE